MLNIIREIKKIGNGFYIPVGSQYINDKVLKKEIKYKISIEEADLEQSENNNNISNNNSIEEIDIDDI